MGGHGAMLPKVELFGLDLAATSVYRWAAKAASWVVLTVGAVSGGVASLSTSIGWWWLAGLAFIVVVALAVGLSWPGPWVLEPEEEEEGGGGRGGGGGGGGGVGRARNARLRRRGLDGEVARVPPHEGGRK